MIGGAVGLKCLGEMMKGVAADNLMGLDVAGKRTSSSSVMGGAWMYCEIGGTSMEAKSHGRPCCVETSRWYAVMNAAAVKRGW